MNQASYCSMHVQQPGIERVAADAPRACHKQLATYTHHGSQDLGFSMEQTHNCATKTNCMRFCTIVSWSSVCLFAQAPVSDAMMSRCEVMVLQTCVTLCTEHHAHWMK